MKTPLDKIAARHFRPLAWKCDQWDRAARREAMEGELTDPKRQRGNRRGRKGGAL